jgi:hypothetical protein
MYFPGVILYHLLASHSLLPIDIVCHLGAGLVPHLFGAVFTARGDITNNVDNHELILFFHFKR